MYCETCCQVICCECTISKEHNTHSFHLISECYPKHHQQLQDSLEQIKRKTANIDTAITDLVTREREVQQQGQGVKEQINTHAQQIIDQVQSSCTHLSQQVDTIVQQKTQTLTAQRQQAQKLRTQLKTCQEKIEHSLNWNQLQILIKKHILMDEIDAATQNADPAVFKPIETSIYFTEAQNIIELKKGEEIGFITSTTYGKATFNASPCHINQESRVTITFRSLDGSPFYIPNSLLSFTLSSPGDKHTMDCDFITSIVDDHLSPPYEVLHNITFTPSTRKDQLMVQVRGVDIPGSPFPLSVILSPQIKPVNMITKLNTPVGVAVCDNGDIVVAERNAHCITILNKNGEKVRSFGTKGKKEGQFIFPHGVAISDGHILVTDNHRLQKLTTDGVCVKSVKNSSEGHGIIKFNLLGGIAVHPTTGQILVADEYNNWIEVYEKNLAFSHTITHKQLKQPGDVAIDKNGYLYIADCANHCIAKFTTTGEHIKKFPSLGGNRLLTFFSGQGLFITIHNDLVYVSEYENNCVSIFDTFGNYFHSFGKGEFNKPRGIATDTSGNLYVCDSENDRIVVY